MIEVIKLAYEHPGWTLLFLLFVLMIADSFQPVKIVKIYEMKKEEQKDER